jgi:hypothetical protein
MALIKIEHVICDEQADYMHRRNMSHSRAIRRLIVDVIRGRDSAARSNDFEGLGEDGGGGSGSCVDFAGTLTGRLQWGHSILWRALLSSTEMLSVHQGQTKWIAIPRDSITLRRAP